MGLFDYYSSGLRKVTERSQARSEARRQEREKKKRKFIPPKFDFVDAETGQGRFSPGRYPSRIDLPLARAQQQIAEGQGRTWDSPGRSRLIQGDGQHPPYRPPRGIPVTSTPQEDFEFARERGLLRNTGREAPLGIMTPGEAEQVSLRHGLGPDMGVWMPEEIGGLQIPQLARDVTRIDPMIAALAVPFGPSTLPARMLANRPMARGVIGSALNLTGGDIPIAAATAVRAAPGMARAGTRALRAGAEAWERVPERVGRMVDTEAAGAGVRATTEPFGMRPPEAVGMGRRIGPDDEGSVNRLTRLFARERRATRWQTQTAVSREIGAARAEFGIQHGDEGPQLVREARLEGVTLTPREQALAEFGDAATLSRIRSRMPVVGPDDAPMPPTGRVSGQAEDVAALDAAALERQAIEEFGITTSPTSAGYILRDGRLLSMAEEGSGGARSLDHRSVSRLPAMERLPIRDEGSGWEYMQAFQESTGAIRYAPEGNGINIVGDIVTQDQLKALQRIMRQRRGEPLLVDFTTVDGRARATADIRFADQVADTLRQNGIRIEAGRSLGPGTYAPIADDAPTPRGPEEVAPIDEVARTADDVPQRHFIRSDDLLGGRAVTRPTVRSADEPTETLSRVEMRRQARAADMADLSDGFRETTGGNGHSPGEPRVMSRAEMRRAATGRAGPEPAVSRADLRRAQTLRLTPETAPEAQAVIDYVRETRIQPGRVTQLPGVRQTVGVLNPGVQIPENIAVGYRGRQVARSTVRTDFVRIRKPVLDELIAAWQEARPAYVGPRGKTGLENELVDWLQNPRYYEGASERLLAAKRAFDESGRATVQRLNKGFGAEIGEFRPADPDASYIPHVQARGAVDDAVQALQDSYTSTRASINAGPAKPRIWQTLRERMAADPSFVPEIDLRVLVDAHDSALSQMAGNRTFRLASGGKTRIEIMDELHPGLRQMRDELRDEMVSLRSRLATAERQAKQAGAAEDRLRRASAAAQKRARPYLDRIDDLGPEWGPELSFLSGQAREMQLRADALARIARTQAGRAALKDAKAAELARKIDELGPRLDKVRRGYNNANPGNYRMSPETFLFHTPEEAKAISQILQTKLNQPTLDGLSNLADEIRMTAFAADTSPLTAIQAPLGFIANPVTSFKALPRMAQAILNPEQALLRILQEEADDVARYVAARGRPFGDLGTEFVQAGRGIERVGAGRTLNKRIMAALDVQMYRLWKTDRAILKWLNPKMTDNVADADALNALSKYVPQLNPAERAASVVQARVERFPVISPSFIAGPAALVKDATSGLTKLALSRKMNPLARWQALRGREQMAIIRGTFMASNLAMLSVASHVASGWSLEDAVKVSLDPKSGRFLSVATGKDFRIPIGGPMRSFARALIPQKVADLDGVPVFLPFAGLPRWLEGKIQPVVSVPRDLSRNRDFMGRPIRKGGVAEQVARSIWYGIENTLPLSVGAISEGVRTGRPLKETIRESLAQLGGSNIYEVSEWERRRRARDEVSRELYDVPYGELDDDAQRRRVNEDPRVVERTERATRESIESETTFGRELAESQAKREERDAVIEEFKQTGRVGEQQVMMEGIAEYDRARLAEEITLDDWLRYDRQYSNQLRIARPLLRLGDEPFERPESESETQKAIDAYFNVALEDFYDSKTKYIDFDGFYAAKDAAKAEAVRLADAARPGGGEEVAAYLEYDEERPIKEMQRRAYDLYYDQSPPKYTELSREEGEALDDLRRLVPDVATEVSEQLGVQVKQSNVIAAMAEELRLPTLPDWWKRLNDPEFYNPEHFEFLRQHRGDLETFLPWLYDSQSDLLKMGIIRERDTGGLANLADLPDLDDLADLPDPYDQREQRAILDALRSGIGGAELSPELEGVLAR